MKYEFAWWHVIVALVVIFMLYKGVQPQAAFLTNTDYAPCQSYTEALQMATEKEATSEYTTLIVRMKTGRGICHPCADINSNGYDSNKLYAVKLGHAYDFEVNQNDLRGRFFPDTRCSTDADCVDLEGAKLDDEESYQCGTSGTFPLEMNCIEGTCKSYFTGCVAGDENCDGCISDTEFPNGVNKWVTQNGITDNDFPGFVNRWRNQEGC